MNIPVQSSDTSNPFAAPQSCNVNAEDHAEGSLSIGPAMLCLVFVWPTATLLAAMVVMPLFTIIACLFPTEISTEPLHTFSFMVAAVIGLYVWVRVATGVSAEESINPDQLTDGNVRQMS